MSNNGSLRSIVALVLSTCLVVSCGSGTTLSTPTPTPIELLEYQAPGGRNLGTLTGAVLTSTDLSTGVTTIRGVGVTLDTGGSVDALVQPGMPELIGVGMRVRVAPIDHPEFEWQVIEDNPIEASDPIMRSVDGATEMGFEIADVAVGEGDVWVVGFLEGDNHIGSIKLSQLDLETGQVTKTTSLMDNAGEYYMGINIADDALWVFIRDTLYRYDPDTTTVIETWQFDGYPHLLAIQDGIAWLSGSDADDHTRKVLIRYDLSMRTRIESPVEFGVASLVVFATHVWGTTTAKKEVVSALTGKMVASDVYVLARIDSDNGQIIETIYYDPHAPARGAAIGGDSIWLALDFGGKMAQADAMSGEIVSFIPVVEYENSRPDTELRGIAYGEGAVWVGHPASGSLIRVDPETRKVTHVFSAEGKVSSPIIGGGRVWMISGPTTISWADAADLISND